MSDKNGNAGAKPDVDTLRAEIQQTRADLGETVQALAAKADVKARTKEQVELTKQKVRAQAVEAGGRVREAALHAGDRVRSMAGQAADRVHEAGSGTPHAGGRTRLGGGVPLPLVFAGMAALVGVILIVRGKRR